MSKLVAVILVNYNTAGYTINCVASLKQYCDEAAFDIIVIDNGSADDSMVTIQQAYPNLIYINNGANLGFAEGNNVGLRYSIEHGYTYSLVLNTDTEVDEDIIQKLSHHLNTHPQAAAVQPAIYWLHNKQQIWNGDGHFNKFSGKTWSNKRAHDSNASTTFKSVDWITGCCMFIRNSILPESGLFNALFFLYYEDVDLSFNMRLAGYELHYLPSCKMYHEAGASAKAIKVKAEGQLNPVIHYYISRNHLWIMRRYGNPLFYPVYFIYNGAYYFSLLLYLLIRNRKAKVRQLIKGIKEGLFTPKNLIWPLNAHK